MRTRRKTSKWRKSAGRRQKEVGDQVVEFRTIDREMRKGKNVGNASRGNSELIYEDLPHFNDAPISWGGFVTTYGYFYYFYYLHDIRIMIFVLVCYLLYNVMYIQ